MAKKKQAKKQDGSRAMALLLEFMKQNPNAKFSDARDELAKQGFKIYPINWGRAMALLGRTGETQQRSAKKAARKQTSRAAKKTAAKRAAKRRTRRKATGVAPATQSRSRATGVRAGRPRIPVDEGSLRQWQQMLEAVNAGGRLVLQFDGSSWFVTSE